MTLAYRIQLWDPTVPCKMLDLPAEGTFAFSPDGQVLAVGGQEGHIQYWEVATGKWFNEFPGHQGRIKGLLFSPDGRLLASGGADHTILLWDLRPERLWRDKRDTAPIPKPDADELTRCWITLAKENPPRAHEAMAVLLAHPGVSLPLLDRHLQAVPPVPAERLQTLIKDLESNAFNVRDRAKQELKKLNRAAEAALRQGLAKKPALDVQRSLEQLLEEIRSDEVGLPPGDRLRTLRAIRVLEALGTPEARKILERLAGGTPEVGPTQQARAALKRLGR